MSARRSTCASATSVTRASSRKRLSARGSLLYGDMAVNIPGLGLGGINIGDTEMAVGELGVGLQYDRVREGGTMFVRLMYEAQTWKSGALFGIFAPDYGFVGPSVALGITR